MECIPFACPSCGARMYFVQETKATTYDMWLFSSYKNHKLCLWANIARALIRKKEPPFAKIEAGNANRTTAKGGSSKWTKKVYHTPAGIANTI